MTLDIGAWSEPTVILTADAITGFSDVGRGRDVMTTANTIRATFFDPNQDYQASDADPWADEDDVSERGEEARDVQFNMAPSHIPDIRGFQNGRVPRPTGGQTKLLSRLATVLIQLNEIRNIQRTEGCFWEKL
ncbi:hypothetical protein GRI33_07045 [Brucella sp. BO3]|uniref:hypothetical protein n=1 Tax=unclassified Brucella TaxID=2632610 RepID=UPI00114D1E71|nr:MULTISPECIES: hypothetical protein [unclassified Brucella]QMV26693.1 hypothetical protein GRI33_07045 [Brucella sp. BO3]